MFEIIAIYLFSQILTALTVRSHGAKLFGITSFNGSDSANRPRCSGASHNDFSIVSDRVQILTETDRGIRPRRVIPDNRQAQSLGNDQAKNDQNGNLNFAIHFQVDVLKVGTLLI